MDENELKEFERLKKFEEKAKKQYKRQNEYIRNNFDRVSVALPKGLKERINATGETVSGFIIKAIQEKLDRNGF